ncbi:MAG: hypothetical protein AAF387_14760 [Pseudomonadota bacterium]
MAVSGAVISVASYAKSLKSSKEIDERRYVEWDRQLQKANNFSFVNSLFGRRSRRFGWGMEIPRGPLAFKSARPPSSLDEFETAFLLATGCGISGWHHGIPFSESLEGLCSYSTRYAGRTFPTAAGFGNTELFYTDDHGTYFVSTGNENADVNWRDAEMRDSHRLIEAIARMTTNISDNRIELPRKAPHYSAHNLWNANVPGSSVFIPVANISEQLIGFLFIVAAAGYTVWDSYEGKPAGDLDKFFASGLLNRDKRYPLDYMEQYLLSTSAVEMGVIGHNIALALQPLGLGGWFYSGISPFSLMGVAAAKGIDGLGFEFIHDKRWGVPNPVGRKGVYEGYCPPFYPNMRAAVEAYVKIKFDKGGTYDSSIAGPFLDGSIKDTAEKPSQETVEAVIALADYIYTKFGKFPGTVPTIFVRYYTQAHRLETRFYDKFFKRNYLTTHRENVDRWERELS